MKIEDLFKKLKEKGELTRDDIEASSRATQIKHLKELAEKYDFLEFVEGDPAKKTQTKVIIKDKEAFEREYKKMINLSFPEIKETISKILEESPQKFISIEVIMKLFKKEGLEIDYNLAEQFIDEFILSHPDKMRYKDGIADREWALKHDKYVDAKDTRQKIAMALVDEKSISYEQIAKWYFSKNFNQNRDYYLKVAKQEAKYIQERPWLLSQRDERIKKLFDEGWKLFVDEHSLFLGKEVENHD